MRSLGNIARGLLLVTSLVASTLAAAQDGATSASTWAKAYLKAHKTVDMQTLNAVRRVAIVQEFAKDGTPIFAPIDLAAMKGASFFEPVPWVDARLTFQLNDWTVEGEGGALSNVFRLLGVDAVVTAANDAWSVAVPAKGGTQAVVKAGKPASTSSDVVAKWLQTALGYDAVVLEEKGGQVLVIGASGLLAAGRQGVVVAGSAKSAVVPQANARASAILEVVDAAGSFAVLRRVISREDVGGESAGGAGIEAGAKIQFPPMR